MTAVGKNEPSRDGSTSSIASSPEPEAETYTQEHPQTQKRKGGRKPPVAMSVLPLTKRRKIYATSEERKQRNRQAQAAFRERRTEYIKQLESTIKHHEETLQNLQQSHRSAADECLMLRYKNSLLERILLEKGIDVQAELRAKTGSPNLGPTRAPISANASPNQPPIQRAMMNRQQQARRSIGVPQKAEGVHGLPHIQPEGVLPNRSPLSQPTPGSHMSSPSTTAARSPNFLPQGGKSVSPNFGPVSQQQQHLRPQQPPRPQYTPIMAPQRPSVVTNHASSSGLSSASTVGSGAGSVMTSSTSGGPAAYYPSPFQSHMDQLGKLTRPLLSLLRHRAMFQEYDEQADMLEDQDPSDQSAGPGPGPGPGPYPSTFPPQSQMQSQGMRPPMQNSAQNPPFPSPATLQPADTQGPGAVFGTMNHLFDPYDPMLDADPFGLSASMHFPTQFQYEAR
ncbi:hypothetical protein K432DRAFT_295818 [Lepidopterella palustris CBS 459.81]|uniref:BZIP domain-containing protein n=1 Tax=Lepidopterella palustris CBS 459.81 TaxID=1314670 RepID=A0A8E2EC45_9PEZI|nr:hypothetical protein K432DRAFT_295818 [Lepidopterella palustris CBS 459.81]